MRNSHSQFHLSCFVGAVAVAMAATTTAAQAQQTYRWVDKDGKVTYSQNPPPAGSAAKVERKNLQGSVVGGPALTYETQQAARNAPVTLYSSPDCAEACNLGRDLLSRRGVPFKEISVTDTKGVEELKKISARGQVPVLMVGRSTASGFQEQEWQRALDVAGYPKSAPPFKPAPPPKPPAPQAAAPQQAPAAPQAAPAPEGAPARPAS